MLRGILFFALLFLGIALKAEPHPGRVRMEGFYGRALINPQTINDIHNNNMTWWGMPLKPKDFSSPTYYGGSIGKVFPGVIISLRYDKMQEYPGSHHFNNVQFQGQSVTFDYEESIVVETIYLMVEISKKWGQRTEFTIGGGMGYATKFEFHQTAQACQYCVFPCEEIVWEAHPTGIRIRSSIGYQLSKNITLFIEGLYELLKADKLTAANDYPRNFNGGRINKGQALTDQVYTNNPIPVDLSGFRGAAGLRIDF